MTQIYGIKNCDTMKKAFTWLDDNGVEYVFHDYKKDGAEEAVLRQAIEEHGWDTVINRRGTTWRALPEDVKNGMNSESAVKAALDNPSLVKRPLLLTGGKTYLGFRDDMYSDIFRDA